MLNFIHWVAIHKTNVHHLQGLPEEELFELVNQFEGGKLLGNRDLKEKWRGGFYMLFKSNGGNGYDQVQSELKKIGLG